MDPARAAALHAVLAPGGDPPEPGAALPAFWHQVYFWSLAGAGDLGEDGHPALGGFIPDLGLSNRMWAGGRLSFTNPLRTGTPAIRTTTIENIEQKTGRSGPLAFVTLRHEITQGSRLCITEGQDLVYRAQNARGAGKFRPAPKDADSEEPVTFDVVTLARYSALTFNAHRIHYDADYCRKTLGYSGVVVHGPLLAQRLMSLASGHLGTLRHFEFRAVSPLIAGERAVLCWRVDGSLWVRGPRGRLHCDRA